MNKDGLRHDFVLANGVQLHVVRAGPADGPSIILLHGFPEFWYGWRNQIEPLAAAGYHLIIPDQRGYNLSDKPKGIDAYQLEVLVSDVVALIDHFGHEQATVVGHDWGGMVAWRVAATHPDRVERLVVLNCPHPSAMARALGTSWRQRRKSWYMFYFQIPWLPERMLGLFNSRLLSRGLQNSSHPGTFSTDDLMQYREAWAQPGAMTSMLNWYRASFRHRSQRPTPKTLTVPTLLLWGAQDRFFALSLSQASIERCADGRLEVFENATHWIHHEEPAGISAAIIEFLSPPQ